MFEQKQKEIEEAYKKVAEAGTALNDALIALRSISLDDFNKEDKDELQRVMQLGHDIDCRTAYVLRSLLVRHGNVLFL